MIINDFSDKTDVIRFLIESGADINSRRDTGETPLHTAVKNKNADVVKILAEKGADVNVADDLDRTPMSYSIKNGIII